MLLAIDFDHTLANSAAGAGKPGGKMPAPMPGALEAAHKIYQMGHKIEVFTARATTAPGREAVEKWLHFFGFPFERVTAIKTPNVGVWIDDRAMKFTSWPQVMRDLPYEIAQMSRY